MDPEINATPINGWKMSWKVKISEHKFDNVRTGKSSAKFALT